MATVKLGLTNLNPTQTRQKCLDVVAGLTGNPDFTNPVVSLVTLTDAAQGLQDLITASASRDKQVLQQRNDAANALKQMLRLEGQWVQLVSQGNAEKILSTGYTIVVRNGHLPSPLPAPQDPKVSIMEGLSGKLKLDWKGIGKSYTIFFTTGDPTSPQTPWNMCGTSAKTSFIATGLTPGTVYSFKIIPIGRNNELGAVSAVVSSMAV